MILDGSHRFGAPPEVIWELLLDPAVLAKVMPGTRDLARDGPDHYQGRIAVTIGPITAAEFSLAITLSEMQPPRSYTMAIDATGKFGFTRGRARVGLEPEAGGTRMEYHAELQVGGKIASVGQRLLDVVSRTMLKAGLEALGKEVDRRLAGGPGAGA
jgi:carbon monoxide dehydrogenase subunit G